MELSRQRVLGLGSRGLCGCADQQVVDMDGDWRLQVLAHQFKREQDTLDANRMGFFVETSLLF